MIKAPLSTEKSIRLMEAENKLVFIVEKKDTKEDIKKELEERYGVSITNVNTLIGPDGRKKAYLPVRPVVGDTWSLYNDLHEFVYGGKDEGRLEGYITRMIPQKDSIVIEISTK